MYTSYYCNRITLCSLTHTHSGQAAGWMARGVHMGLCRREQPSLHHEGRVLGKRSGLLQGTLHIQSPPYPPEWLANGSWEKSLKFHLHSCTSLINCMKCRILYCLWQTIIPEKDGEAQGSLRACSSSCTHRKETVYSSETKSKRKKLAVQESEF